MSVLGYGELERSFGRARSLYQCLVRGCATVMSLVRAATGSGDSTFLEVPTGTEV